MKRDSLLAVCILRAGSAYASDRIAAGRDPNTPPTRRETMRAMWSATQEASKVASLIVMWALALDELDRDELRIGEFIEWSTESSATVHRRLVEFRRLFPDAELPNAIAAELLQEARRRREPPSVSLGVPVAA